MHSEFVICKARSLRFIKEELITTWRSKTDDDVTISPEKLAKIFLDLRLQNRVERKKENELEFIRKLALLTLSGLGGGAQRPGWPNSQLPIRNLLSYDAQTW